MITTSSGVSRPIPALLARETPLCVWTGDPARDNRQPRPIFGFANTFMPRRVRARGGTKTTKVTVVEKDGKRRTKTKPRAQSGRSHPAKNRRAKPRERQHQSGGGQAEPIALPRDRKSVV